jgi:hypothetical protein
MRKVVLAFLLVLGVAGAASASLRITSFITDIEILATGDLAITETLDVTFSTPHHGIEREIPVSYRRSTGENLTIALKINSIEQDGRVPPYTAHHRGRYLVLRIGDPDRTITGPHTYEISYHVGRALLFAEDYLQLYWNATGNEWQVPIDYATATVTLPPGVKSDEVSSTSYVGYFGSSARGRPATVDEENRLVFEAQYLSPGEGLTIDVAIPRAKAGILPPTLAQKFWWFLSANRYAFLPLITLVGMVLLWIKKGKDPAKGTIAPRFEPPREMHPGEAGVLIDDRVDLRDISAMVIELAVKRHLRIKEIHEEQLGVAAKIKGLLGRPTPLDFEFEKQGEPDRKLSRAEQTLFEAIFDKDHPERRSLSSMENEFYKVLPQLKSDLYAGLIKKGYYPHNPEQVRHFYLSSGALIVAASIALGIWATSLYLGIAGGMCGLIVLAFSPIMPRKTKKGIEALRDLLGLSEYIERAEVEKMEFHNAPEKSPQLFETLLPYAIALSLTAIWTKQFEGLLERSPEWYTGTSPVFQGHLFALSMMHLSSGMERTFVSAPRTRSGGRSAWGGGGGFGGGFSGGGFGGGGGRGW